MIDWGGPLSFSGALFPLVFALIRGNDGGLGERADRRLLIAAVVLLAVFVLIERAHGAPMFDLTLFRNPAFVGASIAAFSISASRSRCSST